jgi:hypothetical protein
MASGVARSTPGTFSIISAKPPDPGISDCVGQ